MQIHELPTISGNPASGNYLPVDTGTNTVKIDYTALAKAIIEQYAGSSLFGSAQSVKDAFSAVSTKLGPLAGQSYYYGSGTANQTHNYDLSNGFYLIMTGRLVSANTYDGLFLVLSHSSSRHYTPILDNSHVTITQSGNTISIKPDSDYYAISIIKIQGA